MVSGKSLASWLAANGALTNHNHANTTKFSSLSFSLSLSFFLSLSLFLSLSPSSLSLSLFLSLSPSLSPSLSSHYQFENHDQVHH